MTAIVPFRAGGKSRLPESIRADLAIAMLEDVLSAAGVVGSTVVVTDDPAAGEVARQRGATVVDDPGGGQGSAVAAAVGTISGGCIVVNADLPAATGDELERLLAVARAGAFALVEAADGTTNALALPSPSAFTSLFGPGSAARFRAHAVGLGLPLVEIDAPGLVVDVDTLDDLDRIASRVGARTRRQLSLVS